MTSRRRGLGRAWLVALGVGLAALGSPAPVAAQSRAPTADELKAARELFQEAFRDEQANRLSEALEKFQRVAAVKESGAVRYRIAAVLEASSRLREARDAFRALAASKSVLPDSEAVIADSAAERAHQLDRKIPRLVLRLGDKTPPDARVTVDGASVPVSTSPRPIEVDPGQHLVEATSPTSRPTEVRLVVVEGSEATVTVALEPLPVARPVGPVGPPAPLPWRRSDTPAYVALGGGAALVVTGLVLLAVRQGDISDLEAACGADLVCPASRKSELEATRDQAKLFGPLGVGVGVIGVAGIAVGGWLLLRPEPRASNASGGAPSPAWATRLQLATRPVAGGGLVDLSSAF
jgi:hypothetical protein